MKESQQPQPQSQDREPTRILLIRFGLGTLALMVAIGILVALWLTKPSPQLAPTGERALTVRIITATEKPVARTWRGYGTARALNAANVASQVAGEVVERPDGIDAGAWVEKGDLLIQLDNAEFKERLAGASETIRALEAQLESLDVEQASLSDNVRLAEQAVTLYERELARARDAQSRGAATQNEIDRLERELTTQRRIAVDLRQRRDQLPIRRQEVEAQIRQQRAQARLAQLDVERARITAPISGVLQTVEANVGDWLAVGAPVARIVDRRRIEAPMRMPISAGADLRVGDDLTLAADGPSGLTWTARISRIAPEADSGNRTLTVFAEHEQEANHVESGALLPGQFLIGTAQSRRAVSRIVVPRNAVVSDRVSIMNEDGRVETRRVRVAFYIDDRFTDIDPTVTQWVALEDGLTSGDRVIVSNLDDLEEGLTVRPAERAAAALPPTAQRDPSIDASGSARQ